MLLILLGWGGFFLKIDDFGSTPRTKLYSYFLNHPEPSLVVVEGLIEQEMDLVKQLVLVLYSAGKVKQY